MNQHKADTSSVPDELELVRAQEEHYYELARRALGDSVSLVQDLVDLCEWLARSGLDSESAMHDDVAPPLVFLMACRYQLTIGALAALRRHAVDSFRSTRMA